MNGTELADRLGEQVEIQYKAKNARTAIEDFLSMPSRWNAMTNEEAAQMKRLHDTFIDTYLRVVHRASTRETEYRTEIQRLWEESQGQPEHV